MASLSEFAIIQRYFSQCDVPPSVDNKVIIGIGDDAAVLPAPAVAQVIASDTLTEEVHFPKDFPADAVASRALGVNLSDFAAMGARPRWITMALSLPAADEEWLRAFAKRFAEDCKLYGVQLIGGDTTRGQLSVSLTVLGDVGRDAAPQYLTRSGAAAGDDLWVSGSLGKGAAALAMLQSAVDQPNWQCDEELRQDLLHSFYAPTPRLSLGQALLPLASAAIDISDGLLADANHIAAQSQLQLLVEADALPVHSALKAFHDQHKVHQWALTGGDEYELLFTAPCAHAEKIAALAESLALPLTRIGKAVAGEGIHLVCSEGSAWQSVVNAADLPQGYQHF